MVNINIKRQLERFFIYITGLPGTGKLSTAAILSSMINAVIVNSHLYNNTQICSIYNDAFKCNQVSKEVQDRIYSIVQIIFQAIEAYPIASKNYIFIDELMKNNDYNIRIYNSVVELSKKMGTTILPVVLKCNSSTLQERKKQKKSKNVMNINSIEMRAEDLLIPPNAIEIENSIISVEEVAEEIVSQMHQIDSIYAEDNSLIY